MVWKNMKKREKKEIKVMCALLYMMGLCLALGISLRPVAKEAHPEDRLIQNSDKSVPADGKMQAGKKSVSVDGKLQLEDGQQMSDYVRKDNEAKKVAITFDDGPSGKYTKKLLDGLKKRKVIFPDWGKCEALSGNCKADEKRRTSDRESYLSSCRADITAGR